MTSSITCSTERAALDAEATCKELLLVQAERDRLREELREAEEAVLFADAYIRSELADDYRIVEGDNRVWGEDFTAVRRARERQKDETPK